MSSVPKQHLKQHKTVSSATKTAGVIGGGISGMATAARLAKAGYRVTLFEAGSELGGKLTDERWEGFRFDKGPSLFTMPELLEELFSDCGEKLSDYLQYDQLELVTRYFYPDGTQVNAFSNIDQFAAELEQQIGEKQSRTKAYFKRAKLMYDTTAPVFLDRSLQDWRNLLRFSTFLKVLRIPWLGVFGTMHRFNQKWFKHARTVQLFDRFATYNGSNPYKAPATLNLISYIEHGKGAFYPQGGMIEIRNALVKLMEKLGVLVRLNTRVDKFFIHHNQLKGVSIGDQKELFTLVVSAVDVMQARASMYPRSLRKTTEKAPELSSSAIIYHWAIKGEYPALDLHNIFFSPHYKREFEAISTGQLTSDPTIYVYISSKNNRTDAPIGHENWFVMVNTPPNTGQDWDAYIAKTRTYLQQHLSDALKVPIANLILHETVMDPRDIERNTGSVGGAIYGPASNNKWAAFLRQSNRHGQIKGLYFAGGSVHPGGGIPLCLLSARIATELIQGKH
jgi:phytoene desaturase